MQICDGDGNNCMDGIRGNQVNGEDYQEPDWTNEITCTDKNCSGTNNQRVGVDMQGNPLPNTLTHIATIKSTNGNDVKVSSIQHIYSTSASSPTPAIDTKDADGAGIVESKKYDPDDPFNSGYDPNDPFLVCSQDCYKPFIDGSSLSSDVEVICATAGAFFTATRTTASQCSDNASDSTSTATTTDSEGNTTTTTTSSETTDLSPLTSRLDKIKQAIDKNKTSTDGVKASTDAVKTAVDGVKSSTDGVKTAVDGVKSSVDSVKSSVDATKNAVYESSQINVDLLGGILQTNRDIKDLLSPANAPAKGDFVQATSDLEVKKGEAKLQLNEKMIEVKTYLSTFLNPINKSGGTLPCWIINSPAGDLRICPADHTQYFKYVIMLLMALAYFFAFLIIIEKK